ncbi:MAG TPA: ABC transporter substrate-binding protein [Chloroflexota bacterium]|nr:ABC transporter substrate-binding protein [Chloroflexota bacterium]
MAGLLLAACGGAASPAPASQSAAANAPVSVQASAKPAASTSSAKPAASAGAAAASGSAAAKPAASGLTNVVASYSNVAGVYIPWWIAQDEGIFAQNGLSVDMKFMAGATTTAAMLANEVEFGSIGGGDVISAAANGADFVIVGVIVPTYTFIIEANQSIKQPADLNGKSVGVSTLGSASDIGTRVGLRKLGIDPKNVRIVQEGTPVNATAAMVGGAIEAATISPPENVKLNRQGFHDLIDLSQLGLPASTNTLTVRKSWYATHHDVAQKFIDSLVQGVAKAKKDKAATIKVIQKYLKYGDDAMDQTTYSYYVGSVFPALPYPKADQFKDAQDELAVNNEKLRGFDVSSIFDPSLVQSAADRGLDK